MPLKLRVLIDQKLTEKEDEKSEMKNKSLAMVSFVLALVLSAGVMTLFCACAAKENGSFMHCHDVQMCVFWIGIALSVLALAGILVKNRVLLMGICGLSILLALAAALLPGRIMTMCMMETMRCYTLMKPFVTVISLLIIICSLIRLVLVGRHRHI